MDINLKLLLQVLIQQKLDKFGRNIVEKKVTKVIKDKIEDTIDQKVGNIKKEGTVELSNTLL